MKMDTSRHSVRERLIEAGIWTADDARDPSADPAAGVVLLGAMKKLLARGAYLSYTVSLDSTPLTEVFINRESEKFLLATDADLYVAICQAALALPGFLKQLPEFAAQAS